MKRIPALALCLCMLLGLAPLIAAPAAAGADTLRGAWVASVYNIDFPSRAGLSAAQQRRELDALLDLAAQSGLSALFFQVRPTADALYASVLFPWSAVLSGEQGKPNADGFDPLAYLTREGNRRGIEIHAWINPLRITTSGTDLSALAPEHPARKNPSWTVAAGGALYFDPGLPQVRQLIAEGAAEIVKNYPVAGIHFDDYFYPTGTFGDSASFKRYGGGQSLDDWRRGNIDSLMTAVRDAVKAAAPEARFGVSPFGIWAGKDQNPLGSDTRGGLSTYYNHYADSRGWVKKGLVDYICPQLYWNIGYSAADFGVLLDWWREVCRDTGVELYVGHAVYKVGDGSQSQKWLQPYEIYNQLALAQSAGADGSLFYGLSKLKANTLGVRDAIAAFFRGEAPPWNPDDALYPMPQPAADKGLLLSGNKGRAVTTGKGISILGSCDPRYPLYFEGEPVAVTASGHFCVYRALAVGEQTFTFTYRGQKTPFTAVRQPVAAAGGSAGGASKPETLAGAVFKAGSHYPIKDVTKRSGETVTFGCIAPAGAKVWVEIGSRRVALAREAGAAASGLAAVRFTGDFTFPAPARAERFTAVGQPVFVLEYQGRRATFKAGNTVTVQSPDYLAYATAKADGTVTRTGPSAAYAQATPLARGTADSIYGRQNGHYLLRCGLWVAEADVKVTEARLPAQTLKAPAAVQADRHTVFDFALGRPAPYRLEIGAKTAVLTLYGAPAEKPGGEPGPLFSAVAAKAVGGNAVYTFTFKAPGRWFGSTVGYSGGTLRLAFKNPPQPQGGDTLPLRGTRVLLDAGHGLDPGALGPTREQGPTESQINLAITLYARDYLEARGALVTTTREADVQVSLESRAAAIRREKPDIAVSVHANSLDYSNDLNQTQGLMTFYTQALSRPVAEFIQARLIADLGRNDKGVLQQNLAVCRPSEVPAILIETGFMSNPEEYEWLSDPAAQRRIGQAIGRAIEAWLVEAGA